MTSIVTVDAEGTVTGNTYDKYNTTNPVARRLQAGFERSLDELFAQADPLSLLDVGCGEAHHTHQWAQQLGDRRVVGIDLDDPTLKSFWEQRTAPNLEYRILKAENMPFEDDEFDVATAIEVLEHVPDPEHTVAEMARVASRNLLVSVPREPMWRMLNMARGAYWKDLGNTPGHLNHWSKRSFVRLLSQHGEVVEARSPFPWTMLLSSGLGNEDPQARRGYGAGARILSVGIALTGIVTFAYFSLASHGLTEAEYSTITLLWALLFVVVTVLYRPIEQLLSRTIAERRALGHGSHPLREPLLIQIGFAALFLIVALALRGPLQDDLLDGSAALYWIFVGAVLAYAASYFARGWLAGHQRFELYGGLVFLEAVTRVLFALAVVLGLASGATAVAIGMLAAPCVSLVVVPLAFRHSDPPPSPSPGEIQQAEGGLSLRHGVGFAFAVFVVMAAEQTLINGAVIAVDVTSGDAALAGIVFSILLIARAPLQLFQAVQGSLLPHLAGLNATEDGGEFSKAVRITVLAIAGFAAACAIGLFAVGPWVMNLLFDLDYDWGRVGLGVVALGMGLHLAAGTLNQAALARGHARAAAIAWAAVGIAFMVWMFAPIVDDEVLRAELGYALAAALLCALLTAVYRMAPAPEAAAAPAA